MRALPLIALTMMLAACGKPSSSTTTVTTNTETGVTTTSTSGAPITAETLGIQPGKWETKVEMVDTKVEGAPAGMPAMPKTPSHTVTACVTPEEAKKNPADMMRETKSNCTVTSSVFGGGQIASEANCKLPNGSIAMKTTGTYSPTAIETTSEQAMTMGSMKVTSKSHMTSRRVGDCDK